MSNAPETSIEHEDCGCTDTAVESGPMLAHDSSVLASATENAPSVSMEALNRLSELEAEKLAAAESGPVFVPPSEAALASTDDGVKAWHSNKKVTSLWSNAARRNSWAGITGLNWKKIHAGNDSAVLNMSMMLAHAEQTNANVTVRIESDNTIHEVYVW